MLTENTASATKGVIDNFETLNRTAATESRKAADSVREANRSLVEEMSQTITDATKRFADATKEMRSATLELQHDLGETRKEIKKGVMELPEEARRVPTRCAGWWAIRSGAVGAVRHHQPPRQDARHLEPATRRAASDAAAIDRNAAGCLRPSAPSPSRPGPSWRRAARSTEPRPSLERGGMAPVSSITASPAPQLRDTPRATAMAALTAGHPAGADAAASRCGPPPPRRRGRP
jgi:hypothetical protein